MNDEVHTGAGLFDTIDSKLNVFALANGMDLAKGDGYRRLEWFTEGLERGILIEAAGGGRFNLRVVAWKTGRAESRTEASMAESVPVEEMSRRLGEAIDIANGLDSPEGS